MVEIENYEKRLAEFLNFIKPVNTEHELIRVGNQQGDGGYLIPNDLEGITACFSPGTAEIVDFEENMLKRGIKCFLADGSVERPPSSSDLHFIKRHLGKKDSIAWRDRMKGKIPQMRLDSWMKNYAPSGNDLLLQMDIESSEYKVLDSTSDEQLNRFRIMVIEFHRLHKLLPYSAYERGEIVHRVFSKLSQNFSVVHIHPNNAALVYLWEEYQLPDLLEITFLRKDRITRQTPAAEFPHKLDRANVEYHIPVVLPKCFYS